jgi:hypothetical protein
LIRLMAERAAREKQWEDEFPANPPMSIHVSWGRISLFITRNFPLLRGDSRCSRYCIEAQGKISFVREGRRRAAALQLSGEGGAAKIRETRACFGPG